MEDHKQDFVIDMIISKVAMWLLTIKIEAIVTRF